MSFAVGEEPEPNQIIRQQTGMPAKRTGVEDEENDDEKRVGFSAATDDPVNTINRQLTGKPVNKGQKRRPTGAGALLTRGLSQSDDPVDAAQALARELALDEEDEENEEVKPTPEEESPLAKRRPTGAAALLGRGTAATSREDLDALYPDEEDEEEGGDTVKFGGALPTKPDKEASPKVGQERMGGGDRAPRTRRKNSH